VNNKYLYTFKWTQPYATDWQRPYLRSLQQKIERAIEQSLEYSTFEEAKQLIQKVQAL